MFDDGRISPKHVTLVGYKCFSDMTQYISRVHEENLDLMERIWSMQSLTQRCRTQMLPVIEIVQLHAAAASATSKLLRAERKQIAKLDQVTHRHSRTEKESMWEWKVSKEQGSRMHMGYWELLAAI